MNSIAIELNHISFSYNTQAVLNDCNGSINEATITAILGKNGQGKTTLMKCMLSHFKISSGEIRVFGKDIYKYPIRELAKRISYVSQISSIVNDVIVRDYIVEARTPYLGTFSMPALKDYLIVEKYADILGISGLLSKNINQLSGGQAQLVMIARAMAQETDIILLDEPMAALDLSVQVKLLNVLDMLRNMGKTIIFSTHNPEHALVLNCNTWIMTHGKITYAGLANAVLTEGALKELYGDGVVLINNGKRKVCSLKIEKDLYCNEEH